MSTVNTRSHLDPPGLGAGPGLVVPAPGIRLLLEAYDCARELGVDEWELAVEVRSLEAAGLTPTHLRWLLFHGYAAQGVEQSLPTDARRQFRLIANLSVSPAASFVLTEAGARYALGHRLDRAEPERPAWDQPRRELRSGPRVVKRFKQPAANQELVLQAFEEEGWPPRISDPLPPRNEQDAKRRLHSTICNLNRAHEIALIHFEGGGDGESVCWRWLTARELSEGRARTERV